MSTTDASKGQVSAEMKALQNEASRQIFEKGKILQAINEALAASKEAGIQNWEEPDFFEYSAAKSTIKEEDFEHFQDLGRYVFGVAEQCQTPAGLVLSTVLSAIASVSMRGYAITAVNEHVIPLNIYTAVFLDPSERKSGPQAICIEPLKEIDKEVSVELSCEKKRIDTEIDAKERRISYLMSKHAKTEDKDERENILAQIKEEQENMPKRIEIPSLLFGSDVTPESLFRLMSSNEEYGAIFDSEGAFFDIMGGIYSQSKKANIDIILKSYNGEFCQRVRASSIENIKLYNPLLTLCFCVQEDVLSGQDEDTRQRMLGRGFSARFLYMAPESRMGNRTLKSIEMDERDKNIYRDKIRRIFYGTRGLAEKKVLELSQEAYDIFETEWLKIESELPQNSFFEKCWNGKCDGFILRLAGILHVWKHVENSEFSKVEKETMELALRLFRLYKENSLHVYNELGLNPDVKNASKLFSRLIEGRIARISLRDLKQKGKNLVNGIADACEPLIKVLEDRNLIKKVEKVRKSGAMGAPSKGEYIINPAVYERMLKNI